MRSRKPSLATLLAFLALFVALGGSAVATKHYLLTSTSQVKPSVLKKLRGKSGARGLTGLRGSAGPAGPAGATGAQGLPGTPGLPGTVLAYARVKADGTLETSESRDFSGATIDHTSGSGVYCIHGLSFTPSNLTATVDSENGPGVLEASVHPSTFVFCPETEQVELVTFNPNVGAGEFEFEDFAFYLAIS